MTTHESIRSMLALAAARALDAEEMNRVEQHARECNICRRELEILGLYAQGMRQLPQPIAPADLVARTQARIFREQARLADRRRDAVMIAVLSVASLATSVATWMVVYALTGGVLKVFGTNWVSPIPWFLVSTGLTWMTAVTAAVALGRRGGVRRVYESL